MLKVIVGASKFFTDQLRIQQALYRLYQADPDSVLIVDNTNEGSKLVGAVWSAIGGLVSNYEPNYKKDHRDAGRVRDEEVLRTGGDLCMSFEVEGEYRPWITQRCKDQGIPVRRIMLVDSNVIDAV
jgi:hypothetical protein